MSPNLPSVLGATDMCLAQHTCTQVRGCCRAPCPATGLPTLWWQWDSVPVMTSWWEGTTEVPPSLKCTLSKDVVRSPEATSSNLGIRQTDREVCAEQKSVSFLGLIFLSFTGQQSECCHVAWALRGDALFVWMQSHLQFLNLWLIHSVPRKLPCYLCLPLSLYT